MNLSDTDVGKEWVGQFAVDDQALSMQLINSLLLVSHNDFIERMRDEILKQLDNASLPIALFAEREIPKRNGEPHKLFNEPRRKKNRRADGRGPMPVDPVRRDTPEVGSEGLVSWLITDICREYPDEFISHPSPNKIRSLKVRKFFVVTDFIGSGFRVSTYLQAAWKVASVKSWHSYKLLKFEVIAYSGTDAGVKIVKRHKCKPQVNLVIACPTISSEFDHKLALKVRNLCRYYDPINHDKKESLGFRGSSALIAFSHGCPNNVPRLIHKKKKGKWTPLFPSRVTSKVRSIFNEREDLSQLFTRLEALSEKRIASEIWLKRTTTAGKKMLIILSALRSGPRFDEALSRKTRLIIPEVRMLVEKALIWQLIDVDRRLTNDGIKQLKHAKNYNLYKAKLSSESNQMYYL